MITARPVRRALRLLAGVATAAALAAGLAAAPSVAAPAPGTTEGDALLPTIDQAAELFPWLEGGRRVVEYDMPIFVRTKSCTDFTTYDNRGRDVWLGLYQQGDGSETGGAVPFAAAIQMDGTRDARAYVQQVKQDARRCEGVHGRGKERVLLRRVPPIPFGDGGGEVAWLSRSVISGSGGEQAYGYTFVERVGDRVSYTSVALEGRKPSVGKARAWAVQAFNTYAEAPSE